MSYEATARLSHGVTGETIQPGAAVDLSHLDEAQIARLIADGKVRVVEPAPAPSRRRKAEQADEEAS